MKKSRLRTNRTLIHKLFFICILTGFLFSQEKVFSQEFQTNDLKKRYPEIEGIYEFTINKQQTLTLQIYFKNGKLRHLVQGDRSVNIWEAVPGKELQFNIVTEGDGTFFMTFQKDDEGKLTRYHVVNDQIHFDAVGVKKADFDYEHMDPTFWSDRLGYLERHYNKSEYQVPMRDGVRLFTQVYFPIDSSSSHPILLYRTPYGIPPYGEEFTHMTFPSLLFAKENYILVYQDIRGRSMSEGTFNYLAPYIANKESVFDVDESSDAYDSIEWLLDNVPNHNGKVGVFGSSYPGFTAVMAAIDAHPAVKAVSPQAPMADLFLGDDGHHQGAFYLAHYVSYAYTMGQSQEGPAPYRVRSIPFETPDGYSYFLELGTLKNIGSQVMQEDNAIWEAAMAHEIYDTYWESRSIYSHLQNIRPAILTVGGWYDAEDLLGTLTTYQSIEKQNPSIQNMLVMGPWHHSGWNMLQTLDENKGVFSYTGNRAWFQEQIELPFFNHYLKGESPAVELREALMYDTGTDRWESYDAWPPESSREQKLYFSNLSQLLFKADYAITTTHFDEFISDPAKPVPYTLQPSLKPSPTYNLDYFVEDQRFAASRPDVLVFTSDTLQEDITLAGPITAELYVSTTGTDADWVVKVIDVYPGNVSAPEDNPMNIRMGGYQRLIRGDVIRGKFRNSFKKPESFVPGQVSYVKFELPDILHTFLKGHRIMIQVQSSWFPLIDRNPQKFCNIRQADPEDFQKATHRVFRTSQYPSGIRVRALQNIN